MGRHEIIAARLNTAGIAITPTGLAEVERALAIEPADIDAPNDEADAEMLLASAGPEMLRALKEAVAMLALCDAPKGHAMVRKHNAISLGRAVIAQAEGLL